MSRSSSSYSSRCYPQSLTLSGRSYRAAVCQPAAAPRLLASSVLSPRCFDAENHSSCWSSARTSLSVGEDPQTHPSKAESTCSSCKSQVTTPHYTKYLESKITTMQEQHQSVVMDNMNLNNQLSRLAVRNHELEEALLHEKRQRESPPAARSQTHRASNTSETRLQQSFNDASTSPAEPSEKYERGVQASLEPAQRDSAPQPQELVSISKAELESLEADMRALRDAVRAKEALWDQVASCERSHRKHLALLSGELINARQLAETRYNEMAIFEQKLMDNKDELRMALKELASAKKALKLQKQQRRAEEASNPTGIDSDARDKPGSQGGEASPVSRQKCRATSSPRDGRVAARHSPRDPATWAARVESAMSGR